MASPKKRTKIIAGAHQAVAFARGDCDHEWVYKKSKRIPAVWVRNCRRCGARVTEFGHSKR